MVACVRRGHPEVRCAWTPPPLPATIPRMALSKRAQVTTLLVVFLPVTLACTAYGLSYVRRVARLAEGSSAIPGQLLATRLESMPCPGMCKGGPSYRPRVAYQYEVLGRVFHGDRVTSLNESGSASWAANLLDRYRSGAATVVHFDPAHPDQAWLEDSATWAYWLIATVPLAVVLLFAVAMARTTERRT